MFQNCYWLFITGGCGQFNVTYCNQRVNKYYAGSDTNQSISMLQLRLNDQLRSILRNISPQGQDL